MCFDLRPRRSCGMLSLRWHGWWRACSAARMGSSAASCRDATPSTSAQSLARFGAREVERLLKDAGIVRHRGKIESAINNARKARVLEEDAGSLAAFFWRFEPQVATRPRHVTLRTLKQATKAPESAAMSRELKRRGWTYVGPTTAYASMQTMGLVNDHSRGAPYESRRNGHGAASADREADEPERRERPR